LIDSLFQTSFTFLANGNFNWTDYTLGDLLNYANQGEISLIDVSISFGSGGLFSAGGGVGLSELKGVLRNALKNKNCAALLGGTAKANAAVDHLTGIVNVDAPGYSGSASVKATIDSGNALAMTAVPITGNFQNGQWSGPNFSTYIGSDVANFTLLQQATVEFHELIHVTTDANFYAQALVDLSNMYGQTTNIYEIVKNCGTALPPKF
jgi:hypothetical protein